MIKIYKLKNLQNSVLKTLFSVIFLSVLSSSAFAQSTANYAFSTSTTGSLALDMNSNAVDMSTGTTQLVGAGLDDAVSSLTNLNLGTGASFDFYLMGNRYTQFGVTDNGIMTLGVTPGSTVYALPNGTVPTISAFANDMRTGSDGKVEAKIIGTSPNRTLVVQWTNNMIRFATAAPGTGTWQVRLYETTGVIEYVYGTMTTNAATPAVYYVGFSTNTTINNLVTVNTTTNAASTSATATSNSYTASSTITQLNSASNGTRRVYTFTPISGVPLDPTTLTFTGVTASAITPNWIDNSTNETYFIVTRATDAAFTQNVVTATVASTTSAGTGTGYNLAQAGLSPLTTYYYKIQAANEASLPAAGLTGSQATLAPAVYYWVGTTGGTLGTAANWNTMADGSGTTRSTVSTTDVLIVDGDGIIPGGATTINEDLTSFSIGEFKVTSNTNLSLQSSSATARTITLTNGPGDDFVIESGSTLNLTHATNTVSFVFSGTGNTGDISGTLNFGGNTANTLTTTGGTGTLVTVSGTGVVNLGFTGNSLVGSVATLSFLNGANCNSIGATAGAPPVPLATWAANSNLTITGLTTSGTTATNNVQSFGNFTYNCPASTATMSFWTSSTTAVIKGNLNITTSAAGGLFRALTSGTLTINGNLNVNGVFEVSGGAGGGTINVGGNVNVNGGSFDISKAGASTLKVAGNFIQTAGTIAQTTTTGLLEFNGSSAQTVTLLPGAHGTNAINARINNTAGVNLTSAFSIRNLTVTKGNLSGAGSLTYNGTTSLLTYNGTAASQTATAIEFPALNGPSSLTINNTTASPNNFVSIPFARTLAGTTGVLTLTSGLLDNTSFVLTVPNTVATAIVGGSATSYVKGAVARNLPASLVSGSTYTFPVGKGGYNPFVLVNPITNAGGTVTVQSEVFDANTGGTTGILMGSLKTNRYWATSIVSGNANFTSSLVQLTDAPAGADAIAASATLTGAYDHIGGSVSTINASSITSTAPAITTLPGYFVMGNIASATLSNLIITPSGNQCTNIARTVTVTATPGGGAVTGVVINYNVNGTAQAPVSMTNTTGNDWSGIIPAVTPSNATVTWSVTATDANSLTKTQTGTSYSDEPNFGATATATASSTTVCSGNPTNLSVNVTKNGLATLGVGGSTSSSSGSSFFPGAWGGAKTQYLIKASELTAAGITAGNLSSLAFEPTTSGQTYTGFSLSIGTTALTAMNTAAFATGLTQVYLATGINNGYTPTANVLNTLSFGTGAGSSSTFNWDGTSNIILSFSWSSVPSATTSTSSTMKVDAPGFTCTAYDQADSQTPAAMLASTTPDGTGTSRPKFTFSANTIVVPTAYSWSDGTSTVGTTNPLTVNPTTNTSYTATITANGCPLTANAVAITVNPLPTAPTATNSSQCGTQIPLASVTSTAGANGNGTFNWYAASTGGTALQSGTSATYQSTIAATTTFYVSETGTNLCESARTPVTVTVGSAPALTLSSATTAICIGATSSAITLTSNSSDFTSYTWAPTTNVSGNETTGWTFNPTANITYTLTANNSSTGCSNIATLAVTVNPLPVITSATTSTDPICEGSSTTLTANSIAPAAGIATVGSGTLLTASIDQPTAFCNRWPNYWSQTIYTAAELTAVGLLPGNISSLAYNITTLGDAATNANFTIKIGTVAGTNFASTTFLPTAGFTTVYGPATYTHTASGLQTITFATPFVWDGTSNIVINVTHDGADNINNSQTYYTVTPDNKTLWVKSFNGSTTTGTLSVNRLNVSFGGTVQTNITSSLNWSWSPSTALSATTGSSVTASPTATTVYTVTATNATTTCSASQNVTVNVNPKPLAPVNGNITQCGTVAPTPAVNYVSDPNAFTTPTFNWYAASTGGTALLSTTNTTLAPALALGSNTFYVSVNNPTTGCSSDRTVVTVMVNTPPTLTLSADQTVCNDAVAQMNITSTVSDYNSYIWSPIANLYTDAAGTIAYTGTSASTVYARTTVAGATTYTVNASNSVSGCAALASGTITVLPSTATVTASTSSICMSGTTTLTLSPSTGFGAGSIQWQTSADNSSFTDIGGATAGTYTSPTLTSTTYYRALIKNGSGAACVTSASITITVNNPAITGTTPAAHCGPGSVTLEATGNSGTSLNWYTAATGGSSISTGPSFTTPVISATTTYYVAAEIAAPVSAIGIGASTTISTGLSDDFISPWGHYYGGMKGQFLIKASELTAAGLTSGNLNSITFDVVSGGTLYKGFNLSIGSTSATALTTTAVSGLTNVYATASPAGLTTPASGPLTINFTSPYTWDGTSNIIIETCWTNNNGGGTGTTVKYDATSFVSHNYFRADNSTTICAATTMTGTSSNRPKITFNFIPVCSSARIPVVATINTPPAVTLTATPSTICAGQSTTLDVTSSNPDYSYTWEPGTLSGSTQTVTPSATTTYSLSAVDASGGANDGCAANATITVNVTPLPVIPTVTATPATICAGGSSQLMAAAVPAPYCTPSMATASASGDYLNNFTFADLSNLGSGDEPTDYTYYSGLTANVVAGTPYNLTLEAGGTNSTYAMQFRVWIDYNHNGIFENTESAFNTTAATFSPAVSTGSITVPVSAYNGVTRMRVAARYNTTPLVGSSCSSTSTFGEYEDYDVNITGGTSLPSYAWLPATFLNNTAISNPLASAMTSTTTYTVSVTQSGCSASRTVTVNVNPLPPVTANASSNSVCAGSSVTLTGGGAATYVWDNSVTNGVAFTPSGTLTYNVTGTDLNGCVNTASTTVTVNPVPSALTASGTTICAGTTATLTTTGTGTIGWYDAVTGGTHVGSGASFTTPVLTSSATYFVQDSSAAGCASPRTSVTVTVNPLPPVIANATATSVCEGTSVTLTGGGATSYSWNNSVIDGTPFTPSVGTLTYIVTGTDGNSCTNTASITVTVNPMPTAPTASGATICSGTTATLSTTGSGTIGWYDAATIGNHVGSGSSFTTPVLTSTATYYVQDSSAAGCVSSRTTVVVTVNPLPVVTANATATAVCSGTSVTLTGGGTATSYTWDNSVIDGAPFTPTATATYNVVGTDANMCSNSATITITVNSVTVNLGNDVTQCGGTVTLDAMNSGDQYVWNDLSTAQTLTVTQSGTYSVTVTDPLTSCSASDMVVITINTIPTVDLTAFPVSVCDNGGVINLTGGSPAGGVYSGTGVSGNTFDPTGLAGPYLITYTVTDVNTCSNSDTASITVDVCSGIAKSNPVFEGISVYPNPTSGLIKVSVDNANFSQLTISIVDIQGKEVYNETDKNITVKYNKEINLEKFAKGIYYIKLSTDNDSKVQKLIVH